MQRVNAKDENDYSFLFAALAEKHNAASLDVTFVA